LPNATNAHYIYGNTSDNLSAAGANSDYVISNADGSGAGEFTSTAGAHTHTVHHLLMEALRSK